MKRPSDEELMRTFALPADALKAAAPRLPGATRRPKRHVPGPFVIAELGLLKEAAKAVSNLSGTALMLWLFLVYEGRFKGKDIVQVSNLALAKWGVSRKVKYKALDRLEAAGLIEVVQRGKRSARVRLVGGKRGQ